MESEAEQAAFVEAGVEFGEPGSEVEERLGPTAPLGVQDVHHADLIRDENGAWGSREVTIIGDTKSSAILWRVCGGGAEARGWAWVAGAAAIRAAAAANDRSVSQGKGGARMGGRTWARTIRSGGRLTSRSVKGWGLDVGGRAVKSGSVCECSPGCGRCWGSG